MSQARLTILGALTVFWSFADSHIGQDDHIQSTPDEINEVVGIAGFCDLLPADWFKIIDANRVHLPDFLAHNGVEAKRRAVDQRRQQRHRANCPNPVTIPSRSPRDQTKTKTKTKKQEKPLTPFDPSSITGLDLSAWLRWVEYRIELGKPLKGSSLPAAARALANKGSGQAQAVEHTIASGWTGLREPEPPKLNGRPAPAQRNDGAAWAELNARATAIGFEAPHPTETVEGYRTRVKMAEDRLPPSALRERIAAAGALKAFN